VTLVVLGRWARLVYRPPALDAPDAPLPRSSPLVRGFFLPHHRVSSFRGFAAQAIKSVVPRAAGFANTHGLTNSAMAMKAMMTKAQLAMSA
jgi:hypothetical protein